MDLAPKKAAAPKSGAFSPSSVTVRRFGLADFEPMGVWLVERLRERIPSLSDRGLAGWLRGAITSNEQLLICTDNAVGMAQIVRQPLLPAPQVEEIFVFTRNEAIEDGMAIYAEFRRWAEGIGASRLDVDRWSDVPREFIKQVLGKISLREVASVRIGK